MKIFSAIMIGCFLASVNAGIGLYFSDPIYWLILFFGVLAFQTKKTKL